MLHGPCVYRLILWACATMIGSTCSQHRWMTVQSIGYNCCVCSCSGARTWDICIYVHYPAVDTAIMPLFFFFLPLSLSSELQGIDTGIQRYCASLKTRVTIYCNNWSRYKAWEIYLEHRYFMSTVVHMTRKIVREQCPFAAYSTYLKSK